MVFLIPNFEVKKAGGTIKATSKPHENRRMHYVYEIQ
jgi:hypothetical protein